MTDSDETTALRERLSRLCEAARRINQSLDFDVVLQGVLDSARSLTGARYGVLTLVDDSADPADFLASGMSTDESRALWDMAEGEQWLGYFAGIREPLRLGNLQGHLRTLGLPEFRAPFAVSPALSFLAAPISHGGVSGGQYLRRRTSRRAGVQPGGRRNPGYVRSAGGTGHYQRSPLPGGTTRPQRSGDADSDITIRGARLQRPYGSSRIGQSGGAANRQRPT